MRQATGQESVSLKWGGAKPDSTVTGDPALSLDAQLAAAQAAGIVGPWEMRPARTPEDSTWVGTTSPVRADQSEVVIDQYSGNVLARIDFADNPPVAKAVSWGISFHRGELYGWANVIQNTIAAALALALAVTGVVAWWMRRPSGQLGVPAAPDVTLGWGMAATVVVLMILLPLMGVSLIVALALDWLIFKRMGWFRTAPTPAE